MTHDDRQLLLRLEKQMKVVSVALDYLHELTDIRFDPRIDQSDLSQKLVEKIDKINELERN